MTSAKLTLVLTTWQLTSYHFSVWPLFPPSVLAIFNTNEEVKGENSHEQSSASWSSADFLSNQLLLLILCVQN